MMRIARPIVTTFLIVMLMAGCVGSRKASAPHPAAGVWNYTVETPEGNETGVITFAETEGVVSGHVLHMGNERLTLESIAFEDGLLSFQLHTGSLMRVAVTIDSNSFEGTVENVEQGVKVPISGDRKVD